MKYTIEEMKEYARCRESIEYFADNYIKRLTVDGDMTPIVLNSFQREVIQDFMRNKVFSKISPRQSGKTTVAAIIMLHQMIFKDSNKCALVSYKKVFGNSVIDTIKMMFEYLPDFIKPEVAKENMSYFGFGNGSKVESYSPNYMPRGEAINLYYVDESELLNSLSDLYKHAIPSLVNAKNCCFFALSSSKND